MSTIEVVFCTRPAAGAALIRAVTWSRWSHVALRDGDEVIEAVAFHGVRTRPLVALLEQSSAVEIVRLPCPDPAAAIAAARGQVGTPYDTWGMLGLGFHRDWQATDRWWCSELVAWAAHQGGAKWLRAEALRRVTPQDLWRLAPADMVSPPKASIARKSAWL